MDYYGNYYDGQDDSDELQHHGVKGMKWGVRRYQNYDGTLTPAGRKRLARDQKRLNKAMFSQQVRESQYKIDEKAYKQKGPQAYARWYASGAAADQRRYLKRGKKSATGFFQK